MGETINIFDETPLRMKVSFSSSGYYNFEPNCVYEKSDICGLGQSHEQHP